MFKGKVLRKKREDAGYTLQGLAEALKQEYGVAIDFRTIAAWETNKKATPRRKNIAMVADFLGINLEELYEEDVSAPKEKETEILLLIEKIIKIYHDEPDDERLKKISYLLK